MTNKTNILQSRTRARGILTPLGSQAGGIVSGLLFDLWIIVSMGMLMMIALHADNPNWLKEQKVQIVASVSRSLDGYFHPYLHPKLPQSNKMVDEQFNTAQAQAKK